jgi:aminopeptidase N
LFFSSVQGFLEEFEFDYMSSEDLRDYLTDFTGIDMTGFFETWVFHPGFPHFSIDSFNVIPVDDNYEVTVFARQKQKGTDHISNSNRVELTFMDQDRNTYNDLLEFSGETGSQLFQVPFEPVLTLTDMNDKICDATTDAELLVSEAGEYDFEYTFFRLVVEEIADTAFFRVTHNWVPPDSLKEPVAGLRLSDYRYWTVEGIYPENCNVTGRFRYSKSDYLDNTLITNDEDSLVILYRPNASYDWQSVDFIQFGIPAVGYLYVPEIQPGEYTFAVWDQTVGVGKNIMEKSHYFNLYPNPSSSAFTFEFNIPGQSTIIIFDAVGKIIEKFQVRSDQKTLTWEPGDISDGIYYVNMLSGNEKILENKKIVVF